MSAGSVILLTVVFFELLLLLLGFWGRRRTRDAADYYLGGRRLGPLVAAISASASSSSAWTLLSVSGAAYAWGLSAAWLFPACVGGFLLNWYLLAPALRRVSRETGALTVTQLLAGPADGAWHRAISVSASLIVLISFSAYVASQFLGAGKAFVSTFGVSAPVAILLGSGIVVAYTLLGGFWAVSLTDTLQGLLMAATAVVLPVAALIAVGGPWGLWEGMQQVGGWQGAGPGAADPGTFLSLTRNLGPVGGLGLILGLLGIGLGYPGQPHVVNRFMALREGRGELVRARRLAIAWAVVVYGGMLVLGWCGRVLLARLADKELVFLSVTHELFPPVIAGIMLAAVLSAIMSTADSQLLVAGSAVTVDLGLGGRTPRAMLRRSRWVVLILSAAAVAGALVGSQEIFSRVLFAWSAMGAAFGPLLLVGALKGPVPPGRTLAAMLAGFSLSVTAYSIPATHGGMAERVLPFVGALAICLWPPVSRRS